LKKIPFITFGIIYQRRRRGVSRQLVNADGFYPGPDFEGGKENLLAQWSDPMSTPPLKQKTNNNLVTMKTLYGYPERSFSDK
jgi:hypothetical protein